MRKLRSLVMASAFLAAMSAQPALADWHDHDIHHFGDHDYDHWRGGHWVNDFHDGRRGWWWIVDGSWYFYPQPVYPYPDPYTPPVVSVVPAPVAVGAPSYAYYCHNPVGYYPYVPQCFGHWHRVVTGTTTVVTTPAPQPNAIVTQPAPAPQPPVVAQPAPVPPPPSTAKAGSERAADEHKLNEYAADFENIDPTGQQAAGRLDALEKRVEEFHQALYKRNYNAMEISKNAEDLEHRIHDARDHQGAPPAMAPPPPQ